MKLDSQVPKVVNIVVRRCIDTLGDNLKAILWHGSWARGEQTASSDHDLVLIVHTIDAQGLLRLRQLFQKFENWSASVRTVDELRQLPSHLKLQFAYGFTVLYGEFQPLRVDQDNVLAELRALAEAIAFESRYRLMHRHEDWPRQVRAMYHVTKWAVLAMRARALLQRGHYPETRAELRGFLHAQNEHQILDWIERWEEHRPQFEADPVPLMLHLEAFARRLTESLRHEPPRAREI